MERRMHDNSETSQDGTGLNMTWQLNLQQFALNRSGNIAMMFAIILMPMLAAAGMAFDLTYSNNVRGQISEAADAALLAASRAKAMDDELSTEAAQGIAKKVFDGNTATLTDIRIDQVKFDYDETNEIFSIDIDGAINTKILSVVGRDTMPIDIYAEAKAAPPRILEIAMALDNTYSMTGSKLTTLKTASKNLVDRVMKDTDNTTKVGVVPFSQYVNVGPSRRNESWIDVPADEHRSWVEPNVCRTSYPDRTESNCRTWTEPCSSTRDGITTTSTCNRRSCDVDNGDPVETCKDENRSSSSTWRGCVGSRNHPYNVEDGDYGSRRVPGLMNTDCTQELTPLTDSKTTVTNALDAMAVQGSSTYIPTGLSWAYRLLTPGAPFNEGASYEDVENEGGLKVLIVMSDGANTKSADYPTHNYNDNGVDADKIFNETCDEAKDDDIEVYSIAFEVTDPTIKTLLEDCATSTDHYFNASNADKLVDAFDQIADNLTELALSK
ncbi:MAG: VWA domain-containing protein [Pseudomonadota bacterium]